MQSRGLRAQAALTLALAALIGACSSAGTPDPYHALRQSRTQTVPGALDETLLPVGDFVASTSPEHVYRHLLGADTAKDVSVTLARVQSTALSQTSPPAWVFVTRQLCLFTSKGDLVSDARSGNGDNCTAKNLYVQAVDARTGNLLFSFAGFDADRGWLPARLGSRAQLAAVTTFH
jgi:hypothetical protein